MANSKNNNTIFITTGDKIRILRKKHKLTQEQLSAVLGCNPEKISQYETGKKRPDFLFIASIAQHFNKPTDYFLPTEGGNGHDDNETTN